MPQSVSDRADDNDVANGMRQSLDMLAKSPKRPSTPKASAASSFAALLRLLPGGANQFPGGAFTVDQRLFTAHEKLGLGRIGAFARAQLGQGQSEEN